MRQAGGGRGRLNEQGTGFELQGTLTCWAGCCSSPYISGRPDDALLVGDSQPGACCSSFPVLHVRLKGSSSSAACGRPMRYSFGEFSQQKGSSGKILLQLLNPHSRQTQLCPAL